MTKLAMSVGEAAMLSGIGRTKLFAEIKAGRLVGRKVGKRTIVTTTDLQKWVDSLPSTHREAA